MIRGMLECALDFQKDAEAKVEMYTFQHGEQWYWGSRGPGYANTYRVIEYDDAGLKELLARERKEESRHAT